MNTQGSYLLEAHALPGHQTPEDGSPISSMSADGNTAENYTPSLDESRPTDTGHHVQISPVERLPAVPYDRSNCVGSIHLEPAQNAQHIVQDPELTEDTLHQPRSEAHSHAGTFEGECKYNVGFSSMND